MRSLHRVRQGAGIVLLVLLAALLSSWPAAAQEDAAVRIREVELGEDGATRIVVGVPGASGVLDADAFSVTEDGELVEKLKVTPLLDAEPQAVTVALLVDVSGSTRGEALTNAVAAASGFSSAVIETGVQVLLLSFNSTPAVLTPPTTDLQAVLAGLDGLEAGGETALYDAIRSASQTLQDLEGFKEIVVFSDGGDTASDATIDQALAAAANSEATITAVSLATEESDPAALDALAAGTAGRVVTVADAAGLTAAFDTVAESIASAYVLTYAGPPGGPEELDIAVSVALGPDASASDSTIALNTRAPAPAPPRAVTVTEATLDTDSARTIGLVAVFGALALVLGVVALAPVTGRGARNLDRGLAIYGGGRKGRQSAAEALSLSHRLGDFVERLPAPEGYEDRLQRTIDQAGWPLRAAEFMGIRAGAALFGVILGAGLFGNLVLAVVLAVFGLIGPRIVLTVAVSRRLAAFEAQLPDTLQLLAGALKAGYGLQQALATAAEETDEPIRGELRRVLTESRLGVPIEKALLDMADRLESEDFGWVVTAITIQRQIGGNLAQLLETVANTLREREFVRRQIKVLSAEGKLSATILIALPFVVALYLMVVNPGYLNPLLTTGIGRAMLVGAVGAMGFGTAWMRKVIRIDV